MRLGAGGSWGIFIAMDGRGLKGNSLKAKIAYISHWLYTSCVLPDDGTRLRETGCLAPARSLKNKVARQAFKWASNVAYAEKIFTMAACRGGITHMMRLHKLELPLVAGQTEEDWIENQTKIIHHLCQRARKNCGSALRFAGYRQSRAMDWEQTVPMFIEVGVKTTLNVNDSICES